MGTKDTNDGVAVSDEYIFEISVVTVFVCAMTAASSVASFMTQKPLLGVILLALACFGVYEVIHYRRNADQQ